jgi:hypothetical protein
VPSLLGDEVDIREYLHTLLIGSTTTRCRQDRDLLQRSHGPLKVLRA